MSLERPLISAGIVPVFYRATQPTFLLLRAYNYWDFPKGLVEKGEAHLSSALRELEEETGITKATFPWGEKFYETEPYSNGKIAKYFVALTATDQVKLVKNPKSGIVEHHEFRWCTFEEAKTLLGPRVLKVLQWSANTIGLA